MRPTIIHVMEPADLLAELRELRANAESIARRLDLLEGADLKAASDNAYRLGNAIRVAIKLREDA